jgi:predicted anti-sigma-YlaC factor YlaD
MNSMYGPLFFLDCLICRKMLSARLEGDAEPASPAVLDEHLGRCLACQRWQTEVIQRTTQALRGDLRYAKATP